MTAVVTGLALAVVLLAVVVVVLIIIMRGYARRFNVLEDMAHRHRAPGLAGSLDRISGRRA